jgi:hypothetical protein
MDEDLKNFEAELMRLRPVAPSRTLEQRVERELAEAGTAPRKATALAKVHWVWFVALPAAAALALLLSRPGERSPAQDKGNTTGMAATSVAPTATVVATDALKPVAAENVLYAARDEGLVVLEDGTPARRERLQFVDTITWKNPRTNASLRWTVPREEVRVVPIAFQ